jgi:uncharacterized protein YfaS (alpha-2-macroglobulin family)
MRHSEHRADLRATLASLTLLVFAHGCASPKPPVDSAPSRQAVPAPSKPEPWPFVAWEAKPDAKRWKRFDELVGEQKLEQASKLIEERLAESQEQKQSEAWARALIRYTKLRMALHGYEKAVRWLKAQSWPPDLLGQSVLNLYYAATLVQYAQAYSWEIRKRERVSSGGEVDLKAWTIEQIYAEAQRAYEAVWQRREQLGKHPVALVAEHLQLNTYPRKIRATLRDTVSYLRVELLRNTAGWRPEHENEIYMLDLTRLLGAPQAKPALAEVSLVDPAVHPLVKVCAVLDDLERWHLARGEKEAALEARLTRLRVLHARLTQSGDRMQLRENLRKQLSGVEKLPWWAMGMAVLAEFVRAEKASDRLVRARQIAQRGAEAFPQSVGGKRCASIVGQIEAPSYQLEGMASDGLKRRSIGVRYKNLPELHFRAYPIDLPKLLSRSEDYNLLPNYRRLAQLISGRSPSHSWSVPLEQTIDYDLHRADVVPPIDRPGYYLIVASAREGFGMGNNVMRGLYLAIGDLVLLKRRVGSRLEVTALSGAKGRPISGAKVWLYQRNYRKGHRAVRTVSTGRDGTVRLRASSRQNYFLLAQKGSHVALDPSYTGFYQQSPSRMDYGALVYTDRSIYRPGQTIHFKTVVYRGRRDRGEFQVAPDTSVTLRLDDGNNQEVAKTTLTTNSYGSASGIFVVPKGRLLGRWQLRASRGGATVLRVEEYKRPTFEAKLLAPNAALRLNRPATIRGEARYLFGLPLSSGTVRWRVTRQPQYPWWWYGSWWRSVRPSSSTQTVAAGSSEVDAEGRFSLEFTPSADERLGKGASGDSDRSGVTYRYVVKVEVTDEGGESRTATRAFRLGFIAVQAQIGIDNGKGFVREGQPGALTVQRRTLDGEASPGKGRYRLVRLKMPAKTLLPADQPVPVPPESLDRSGRAPFRTAGDRKRPRWAPRYDQRRVLRSWADGKEQANGTLVHDESGVARLTLPALASGAYRLHYTTRDAFGAVYRQSKTFIVAGQKPQLALPAYLMLEQSSVRVGETARLFVGAGFAGQRLVLDFYRSGERTERRVLQAGRKGALVEIPVTEAHRGGFGVTLTALRDHQLLQFRQGVYVPWDNKQLDLSFSTFRDRMRPGAKERWTVTVKGPAGRKTPVRAAEVLAYMYDRSLDAFAPHAPPSPLALFPNRSSAPSVQSTLGTARGAALPASGFRSPPSYTMPRADALRLISGYGLGGVGYRGGYGHRLGRMESAVQPSVSRASPRRSRRPSGKISKEDSSVVEKKQAIALDKAPPAEPELAPAAGGVEVRQNFSETAFFEPHLLTGADGSVSFEFTVPDSVTSWKVWAHAITRDLKSGSAQRESKTVKELMVRPYLPRFLREGDRASIKVVVNNASERPLQGRLTLDILDPDTEKSVRSSFGLSAKQATSKPFRVAPRGGTNLTFPLKTPAKVGLVAFRVVARAERFSDGELRPLPVLPGRMHLSQSRFVTLKDQSRREMTFPQMKTREPTRIDEQLVVTIDGQLFYSVLSALPYLVNYPYNCTEQTLNRFLSTGILASMYDDYPAIEKMAKTFSRRKTRLERWDQSDPNRKMALEETPWLQQARGGPKAAHPLLNVLDPRITRAQRTASLARLRKAQTSLGAFPWFPGGPPSPYITLYVLHGFSKALEFGVEVPKPLVRRAWRYMKRHYIDEVVAYMRAVDCCWEFITFLNYVLSNYPDASWTGGVFDEGDRRAMLAFSFRHWKQHSPYLKGYLALTLERMGRSSDAKLVWDSVMDSARTEPDRGTFWAAEDRSWLWYNDSIETHAFAVRTAMELLPESKRSSPQIDGMVLWLFLNKKLNHWKSTRATAEVIYSLAHYLKRTAQLGQRESIRVTVGDLQRSFEFAPDRYTGKKNQLVISGPQIDPGKHATVVVSKQTRGYAFASATWHFSTEKLPEKAEGELLRVTRRYFKRVKSGREVELIPLSEGARIAVGDEVEVQLMLTSEHPAEYVHLRDPRPAGFEPVSFTSKHKWNLGVYWYEEIRDSGTNFFFERLPQGEYPFKYRLRATMAGTFKAAPATVQPMYAPEFTGYSAGTTVTIH